MGVFYVAPKGPVFVVGRDRGCDLVLDDSYVSRKHLSFKVLTCDVAFLEVIGTNGATVGGIKQNKGYSDYVSFGQRIVIGSHEIVWVGEKPEKSNVFLGGSIKSDPPDIAPFEIEGPPARKIPEKPSVMLAAGPALTMAIPIILGVSRSVAVLSSIFAAIWAAANVLTRARKQKSEETRRKNTYMSYIAQCEEAIRCRLRDITEKLKRTYPEVGDYLKHGGDPFILWNADPPKEHDILVRTGIGRCHSPMAINIPKERFAGVDDSLKELPGILQKKYDMLPFAPYLTKIPFGSVHAIIIRNSKDLETLSAIILQLAAKYSPKDLKISMKTQIDIMRYYMWITLLPHFDKQGTVAFTDNMSYACEAASTGNCAVLIARSEKDLPAGVAGIINTKTQGVRYDKIPEKIARSYAAQLARLWGSGDKYEGIPEIVPFGKLFLNFVHEADPSAVMSQVLAHYKSCDVRSHISAPIGIAQGGEMTVLDLHEKVSGPHGLIAGTTGSGKSELLTTLILSFAAMYPPDRLAFFLVDYKGGGMSDLFLDLPHLAGAVSNLSPEESKRAMIALRSENVKRQKLFAMAHVNCINDYTALYESGDVTTPLPHVLIIVDEFAELKREEPEFLDCLISVSQTGRSLGMHLILATQKPSGVIDDRIRANSRFRMALRLVDRADSNDLIGKADATDIKECGRAILQVGNDEIFECFQSGYAFAYVGGNKDIVTVYEDLLCEKRLWPQPDDENSQAENKITWFELFMNAIRGACDAGGFKRSERMWLPPLPEDIEDDKAYAYFDDPYDQKYEKAVWDPVGSGNLLLTGRSGSGKSEMIRTMIDRLGSMPEVYVIDCGGGKLKELEKNERCGGYVDQDDPDNMERLAGFVHDRMITRKKKDCSRGSPILLVLDDIDEIRRSADPNVWEHIVAILSGGVPVGVYVLASSRSEPDQRTGVLFNSILFLGEHDPYCVSALLKVSARDVPRIKEAPGRGIGLIGERALEFQAVRNTDPVQRTLFGKPQAEPYPYVPQSPMLEQLLKRAVREYPPQAAGPGGITGLFPIPVGYEEKSGKIFRLPLDRLNCILVCGPLYSGRHTFLFNMTLVAARYGIKCVRADTYRSLIQIAQERSEPKIIVIENITSLIAGFYEAGEDAETERSLAALFENPPPDVFQKNNTLVLTGIIDNEARLRFSGREILDSILKRPYGISFGGRLDENRILDYSYLSFSKMQEKRKSHNATILKFDENIYSGPVILPGKNQCG